MPSPVCTRPNHYAGSTALRELALAARPCNSREVVPVPATSDFVNSFRFLFRPKYQWDIGSALGTFQGGVYHKIKPLQSMRHGRAARFPGCCLCSAATACCPLPAARQPHATRHTPRATPAPTGPRCYLVDLESMSQSGKCPHFTHT
jgi:hypothetical protein